MLSQKNFRTFCKQLYHAKSNKKTLVGSTNRFVGKAKNVLRQQKNLFSSISTIWLANTIFFLCITLKAILFALCKNKIIHLWCQFTAILKNLTFKISSGTLKNVDYFESYLKLMITLKFWLFLQYFLQNLRKLHSGLIFTHILWYSIH